MTSAHADSELFSPAHAHKTANISDKPPRNKRYVIGSVIAILSLLAGFTTYFVSTGFTPIAPSNEVFLFLVSINALLLLTMAGMIGWQVASLWSARKEQAAGARLHVRFVSLFTAIAALPAIVLAILATLSLYRGLDQRFSGHTQSILNNSDKVAEAYVTQHKQVLRADILAMSKEIDQAVQLNKNDPDAFKRLLSTQATLHALPMAFLIDPKGKNLNTIANQLEIPFFAPSQKDINQVAPGQVLVIEPIPNLIGAILELEKLENTYLYVFRPVDSRVRVYINRINAKIEEDEKFKKARTGLQVAHAIIYIMIALTFLFSAIWLGLWFANRLVAPIRRLIGAAQKISEGDLDVTVKVKRGEGDLGQLSSTFNHMTTELKSQHSELVSANTMLDDRRRFIEAVLSGVTAGVIGIDESGNITLVNRSAEELLFSAADKLLGFHLEEVVPEFAPIMQLANMQNTTVLIQDQVNLFREGVEHNFAVRVTRESVGEKEYGFVVTFDDMTDLVTAQRASAWADVARRIAHEIKNPLTPIQLSAERIRRKYGKVITEDREVFDKCTDTIIRQVGDIGRMVDEFSSFARMPKPEMKEANVLELIKEAVFLFQVSKPEIEFDMQLPSEPLLTLCDSRIFSQALTNLVKNATEAIESVREELGEDYKGRIRVKAQRYESQYTIEIIDNGIGLPEKNRNRLLEPYMTTREKGTGLGLAIVQKITEQHGGTLTLEDAKKHEGFERGACIRMTCALNLNTESEAADANNTAENNINNESAQLDITDENTKKKTPNIDTDERGSTHRADSTTT